MPPKFSLQIMQDFSPGKAELHPIESNKLMAARHEMEAKLSSLREAQRDLVYQLKDAQSGIIDFSKVRRLRMSIMQLHSSIEGVSLDLARLNHQLKKKN
jgi:flagellar biosynthesis chaperone FliJ